MTRLISSGVAAIPSDEQGGLSVNLSSSLLLENGRVSAAPFLSTNQKHVPFWSLDMYVGPGGDTFRWPLDLVCLCSMALVRSNRHSYLGKQGMMGESVE